MLLLYKNQLLSANNYNFNAALGTYWISFIYIKNNNGPSI